MKFYNKQNLIILLIFTCITAMCFFGCEKKKDTMSGGDLDYYIPTTAPEEPATEPARYNKTDTVVIIDIKQEEKNITVKGIESQQVYVLNYNGGTNILSKSGQDITAGQLSKGQIADVYYVDGSQKLIKLQISNKSWENTMAQGLVINESEGIIKYAGEKYSFDSGIIVLSGDSYIGVDEIIGIDEVTIRGFDKKIVSIVVNKGHGFLKLTDSKDFEGGVVEIGSRITKIIEKDMVIAVPEGTYTFTVSNNGIGGESEITVDRNDTIPVSLIKYKNVIEKYGLVKFSIKPEGAVLTIDGEKVDYTEAVQLQYGTHTIKVSVENYEDYTTELTVDNTYKSIAIDMTAGNEETEASTEGETEYETVVDSEHKIYISSITEGVSVYFDGLYKGTAPASFEKVTGTHIIILMKSGYVTKIYSVEIPDDDKDYVKVFDALEKDD